MYKSEGAYTFIEIARGEKLVCKKQRYDKNVPNPAGVSSELKKSFFLCLNECNKPVHLAEFFKKCKKISK